MLGDIIVFGVDIRVFGVDIVVLVSGVFVLGAGVIVLASGVLVLGADIVVLVSGRISTMVITMAKGGVKRGVVNHVRRLEAGWCGHVLGDTKSHRGRGAPYYRRILGGRLGQGLGCRETVRRSVRGR